MNTPLTRRLPDATSTIWPIRACRWRYAVRYIQGGTKSSYYRRNTKITVAVLFTGKALLCGAFFFLTLRNNGNLAALLQHFSLS